MGSYGTLRFGELELLWFKNGLSGLALEVFTESDRREFERERPMWEPEDGEEHRFEWATVYECTAAVAKQRLESRGYSVERAMAAFQAGVAGLIDEESSLFWEDGPDLSFEWDPLAASEFSRDFTFEELIILLRALVRGRLPRGIPSPDRRPRRVRFVTDIDYSFWGMAKVDPVHAFRTLVEAVPRGKFTLDISELVENGWIPDDQPLCDMSPKFVVLTEGKSDRRILSEALRARAGHMAPYYSFLDFDLGNLAGGAGQLVTIVKALIAARLPQRVIAVLDNDAAAADALRSLNINLPSNIRVIRLPDLPLARRYPTVGPQGVRLANVNGRAVSIEMFLGKNNIQDENGKLRPVIWSSYVPGVQLYQGEIRGKAEIASSFVRSLSDPSLCESQDWSGVDRLLRTIFFAFRDSAATGYDPYSY